MLVHVHMCTCKCAPGNYVTKGGKRHVLDGERMALQRRRLQLNSQMQDRNTSAMVTMVADVPAGQSQKVMLTTRVSILTKLEQTHSEAHIRTFTLENPT